MPISNTVVTLNAVTPTLLASGRGMDTTSVLLTDASATIFVGGASVTAANGASVASTDKPSFDLGAADDLYGIASAATPTVRVLRTRQ